MSSEQVVPHPFRFRALWATLRLATSAALLVAIVAQLASTISYARGAGHDLPTAITNHLSYFTVMSTTAGAVVLAIGGIWLARRGRGGATEPHWISVLFLCVGSAVVITGIVYNLLLRNDGVPDPDTLAWASEVKHVVAPLVFALDLALHVARRPMRWSDVGLTMVYPVLWAVYTLVRGEFVTDAVTGNAWWYPYGFLDPHRAAGGYAGVALYVVGIAAALALIAALSVWGSRRNGAAGVESTREGIGQGQDMPVADSAGNRAR